MLRSVDKRTCRDLDLLRDARRVLRERGWIQGRFREDEGGVCLLGSVMDGPGRTEVLVNRAVRLTELLEFPATVDLVHWNDTVGRTAEEVDARIGCAINRRLTC